MSSIKHPGEKKNKSLTKDHRIFTWGGNKTFRGLWRKKKRRLAKKERRAANSVLMKVDSSAVDDADSPKRQVLRRLRKTGVVTLGRAVDIRASKSTKRFSMFAYSSRKRGAD